MSFRIIPTNINAPNLSLRLNNSTTAVGQNSLASLTTGTNNTVLGLNAGITLTSGSGNIVLGADADVESATSTHTLVMGGTGFHEVAITGGIAYTGTSTASLRVRVGGTNYRIPLM